MRILLAALAALCLFCVAGACATRRTGSAPTTNPLMPATSHFWCGEHCSLAAGCEEGLVCICGEEIHDEDWEGPGVSVDPVVVETAFLKLRALATLDLTIDELNRQPYEIRVVHGLLDKKMVCGVFPKYVQFGSTAAK